MSLRRYSRFSSLHDAIHGRYIVDHVSGCWLWGGGIGSTGYGVVCYRGKNMRAHRVSWVIKNGIIPNRLHVLHKCDVRNCINPSHLYLGDHQQNMKDMKDRGRSNKLSGERHPLHKLTEDEAIAIRSEPGFYSDIAKKYGVSKHTVNAIKQGRLWSYLSQTPVLNGRNQHLAKSGEDIKQAVLTNQLVLSIKSEWPQWQGSLAGYCKKRGLPYSSVSKMLRGKTWNHL